MLFSFKELKRLANLPSETKVDDVVNAINSIGFEVEGTEDFGKVEGIKFGLIEKVYKNPNADNLNVCEIKFNDKNRIIQTNADNVFEGMYVVAFVPGSKIDKITFAEKEMKGIVSEGMLSSLNEFGIDKELLRDGMADGIQGYENINIDMDPIEYLGLDDTLIDIDILSNRADAQSYLIMANEIAAYFGTNIDPLKTNSKTFDSNIKVNEGRHIELTMIEGKKTFDISLREIVLLAKNKIKSISDIVDLTNLSLIMTGQPTHAYDKNKVGNDFTTTLSSNEVTLFGNKVVNLENDLVISSNNKQVSLAGVMGFEETGVSKQTNEFVLELGIFNIKEVRKAQKTIKMNSLAGNQSSKIISKGTTKLAIDYLSTKLNDFSAPINFIEPKKESVSFSIVKLSQVAGFDISKEERFKKSIESLELLGFEFKENEVMVPAYRSDVKTQQDLNEEVLRFYGYDNLPNIAPKVSAFEVKRIERISDKISSMKYSEVMIYTLTSEDKNFINPFDFKDEIKLETYVSKDREIVRNSQILPLLEVVEYNLKRNMDDLNIFSVGMINNGIKTISLASTTKDFNEIKSDVIELLPNNVKFIKTKDNDFHPGVSADIYLNDKKIGVIGKVNPKLIDTNAFVAEIMIIDNDKEIVFNKYSNDPLKHRDITFELALKENIDEKISNINCIDMKVIDTFIKEDIRKVTVRFKLDNVQLEEFEKKFN